MDELGESIEYFRQEQGFRSGSSLAKKSGICRSHYSKISKNKKQPSVQTLENIAQGLKLPLTVIILHAEALKAGKDDTEILKDIKKFFSE